MPTFESLSKSCMMRPVSRAALWSRHWPSFCLPVLPLLGMKMAMKHTNGSFLFLLA